MTAQSVEQTTDLTTLSARPLADKIAGGEVSSAEAVEAYIDRIERVNPDLNAVVIKRFDEARAEAREADQKRADGADLGPLHGVPITVKESLAVEGTPATFGISAHKGNIAEEDGQYVTRLKDAGAIILGKTNVAQLLAYLESDNPVYGRTNNPWNLNRTSGGSSGGEAAILAARGSALGFGTDIGGSVRNPAAFCGIASIKPTEGRTPDPGRLSIPIGQRAIVSQIGTLARNVADVDLGLQVLNGGRNPDVEPPMPLGDPEEVEVADLRVAYYEQDESLQTAPAVQRAVREAVDALRDRGAQVTEWSPPDVNEAVRLFFSLLGADAGKGMRRALAGDKPHPGIAGLLLLGGRSRFTLSVLSRIARLAGQPSLASLMDYFGHHDTDHYWQNVEAQMDYKRRFKVALDKDDGGPFDVIVCPASALPAFKHGTAGDIGLAGAYTILYNVLGYPAGVVPVTRVRAGGEVGREPSRDVVENAAYESERNSEGLPVAVQVVARPWREHVALAAMQAIEQTARTKPGYPHDPYADGLPATS